jgi:hypothetical protein
MAKRRNTLLSDQDEGEEWGLKDENTFLKRQANKTERRQQPEGERGV